MGRDRNQSLEGSRKHHNFEQLSLPRGPLVAQRRWFGRFNDEGSTLSGSPVERGRLRQVAVLSWVLALSVVGCGNSVDLGTSSVTCDQYSQRPLLPAESGGDTQSSTIVDLLEQRGLSWNVQLINEVQSDVNDFCGKPSPKGSSNAKRNNSRPISEAVDWDKLPQN
jgi:hypothetical protein